MIEKNFFNAVTENVSFLVLWKTPSESFLQIQLKVGFHLME